MFNRFLFFAFFGALLTPLAAAPMTLEELDFLVRQHTPDDEIVSDVAQRKLVISINEHVAGLLKKNGASDGLLARLRDPAMVLTPEESRIAFERMQAQKSRTHEEARRQAATHPPPAGAAATAEAAQPQGPPPAQLLDGKLVKLDGDMLKPYDARALDKVRVYAFYYSAMWCGPCRKFTPQLVAAYTALKAQHPEFELIFVSRDHDEFNMSEYMRNEKMPWPAVRFDAVETLKQFSGESIPWLVCVSETGQPLTKNGVDKKFIPPDAIWNAIPELLASVRR